MIQDHGTSDLECFAKAAVNGLGLSHKGLTHDSPGFSKFVVLTLDGE